MDVSDSVKACVTAGPGDLMAWEVSACLDIDGMRLEVIGRGPDLELAAATAMAVLTESGATLNPAPDNDPLPPSGDALLEALAGERPDGSPDGAANATPG
jgi:hypothetical protein